MKNFVTKGPAVKPVKSESWWCDTRPSPKSYTHGVYHSVLDARAPKVPEYALPINPVSPKKPRGTI